MNKKQLLTKRERQKFLSRLRIVPGYAGLLAEKHDLSKVTIYRILRGVSNRQSIQVMESAYELIEQYNQKVINLTSKINGNQN